MNNAGGEQGTALHVCAPGCKKECCAGKEKSCAPGCTKACCAGKEKSCAPGCTKACCVDKNKKNVEKMVLKFKTDSTEVMVESTDGEVVWTPSKPDSLTDEMREALDDAGIEY